MAAAAASSRPREIKFVLLGDSGVGKSSLVLRFVAQSFRPFSESTIGASFMSKQMEVDGGRVKMQIWDTAGQERYHSLAPMYYRGASAAIVVYDITRRESFATLQRWVTELQEKTKDIQILVAGNKKDLEVRTSLLCLTPPQRSHRPICHTPVPTGKTSSGDGRSTGVRQEYRGDLHGSECQGRRAGDRHVCHLEPAGASPGAQRRPGGHLPGVAAAGQGPFGGRVLLRRFGWMDG